MKKILQKYILYYLLITPFTLIYLIAYVIKTMSYIAINIICLITNSKDTFDDVNSGLLIKEVEFYNAIFFDEENQIELED